MKDRNAALLAPVELYLLLTLADGESYGYAMLKRIEEQSGGAVRPDIGALYRVLARLVAQEWVEEADPPVDAPDSHPGRARRYYGITPGGRAALRAELVRLRSVIELAEARNLLGSATA